MDYTPLIYQREQYITLYASNLMSNYNYNKILHNASYNTGW